jgi:P-type Cu+ transporter
MLGDRGHPPRSVPEERAMEIDPVCAMEVDPSTAEWRFDHEGKTYYFCSRGCLEEFAEDPAEFIG